MNFMKELFKLIKPALSRRGITTFDVWIERMKNLM